MTNVLGVDIGGTKTAAARVNERAEISARTVVATQATEPLDVSLAQVWRAMEAAITAEVRAIGICAPGPLNPKTGVVINPPNLPHWREVPLKRLAEERFGLPVRVENDANAAGLAEARFGAARGYSSVFYATLSTGIGAGIILDGEIYHGKNGFAAEGGHVTIDYRSETICGCGVPGCIEALASGSALERMGAYDLDEIATRLAAWLGSIVSLLDPDAIVIGGGVAQIGEPLFERLRRLVPRRTVNPNASETPILPAAYGADAGILGAACTVLGS